MISLLALSTLVPLIGAAEEQAPASHVRAELISEQESVQPGKPFAVALRLTMKDGWHTYWKNPGDSGMPTSVEWLLPPGFKASPPRWPAPQRFAGTNSATYGYSDEAALLFDLRAPAGLAEGSPVALAAKVKWLECREMCVPGRAELSLRLPARSAAPKKDPAFAKARAKIPGALGKGAFSGWAARAFRDDGRIRLRLTASGSTGFLGSAKGFEAVFFPYDDGVVANGLETTIRTDGPTLMLEIPQARAPEALKVQRLSGVLALKHLQRSVEISVPIENRPQ